MLATVLVLVVLPMTGVSVLLLAVGRLQRAREERIAHQVAVTDAIHAELGAVVSPVVKRRFRRGWRIEIAVPFERAAMVGRVVAIAQSAMVRADPQAADRVKVVLTTQEARVQRANVRRLQPVGAAPLGAGEREAVAWTGTSTSRANW